MTHTRGFRLGTAGALALVLALGSTGLATAQDYPTQDIHVVTGFPPGSGADVLTRYFAEKLRPLANRAVIVENKVGASGAIAVKYSALAKPDGHTMYLSAGSATAAQMHLFKTPPVDVVKAFQIAATLNRQAFMITVDAKSPYKTLADLTAAMKKKGKDASYATAATSGIVLGEMYKSLTGIEAVEVRYKDSAGSLNDMQSGRVDYGSHDPVFSLAQAREGRLRILAHSAGKRLQAIPDIPTMTESGVPMDLTSWWAVHVPSATPRPVVMQINKWFNQILAMPDTKAFLNKFGGDPFISTPEEGQALFVKEDKAWAEYVRIAKIEPQS
ncbi:MAG TPA: tripartite tricarboxylate transporter substrate binding protein [Xanthobacteraceae bacterium]|nr:tripartite tricarboxylate transporter substrate binding protein [Xanthobacteraceae bacterium]